MRGQERKRGMHKTQSGLSCRADVSKPAMCGCAGCTLHKGRPSPQGAKVVSDPGTQRQKLRQVSEHYGSIHHSTDWQDKAREPLSVRTWRFPCASLVSPTQDLGAMDNSLEVPRLLSAGCFLSCLYLSPPHWQLLENSLTKGGREASCQGLDHVISQVAATSGSCSRTSVAPFLHSVKSSTPKMAACTPA